ncbi:MAG TPA: hypothetical protein DDY78_15365 [Planctomycetales bacterium]|jgi:tetratricopeptide (TPR) repeat protein|nr:hypothetical protein [Planctomycetales bacterium]
MTNVNIDAILEKSKELRLTGEYIKAIRVLTDVLEEHADARLYNSRGRHWWLLDRPEAAVADFTRAIELDSDNVKYHLNRGCILSHLLKRNSEAVCDFEKVLELEPTNAEAHQQCCLCLLIMGKPDRAWEHAAAALRLAPGEVETQFCVGEAQMSLKRFPEAVEALTQAVELDPDQALYWSALGRARRNLGSEADLELALLAYSRAIELNASSAGYFYSRGTLRWQLEMVEGARADLRHALTLNPDKATLMLTNIRLAEIDKMSQQEEEKSAMLQE